MRRTSRILKSAVRQSLQRLPPRQLFSALLSTTALISVAHADAGQAEPAPAKDPQASSSQPQRPDNETLGEVVITARSYRPEEQTTATGLAMTLVETPQAISVLSEEIFRVTGTHNVYDALDLVPGANRKGQGYGRDNINLRGNPLGTLRVNGAPFDMQQTLEGEAFERVEVVRGPATALYGISGSFGGEINNILKRPQETFGGSLQVNGASFDLMRYTADVTGPIPGTDGKLRARLVGMYQDWGRPQKVVDIHNDKHMVMAALSYDFTEATQANLYFYDSEQKMDPTDGGPSVLRNGQLELPPVGWDDYYYSDSRNSLGGLTYQFLVADISHNFANGWKAKAQATQQKGSFFASYYYPFGPAGAYGLGQNEVFFYTFDTSRHADRLTFDTSLGGDFELGGRKHQFFAALEYHGDTTPYYQQVLRSVGVGHLDIFEGGRGVLSDGSPIPLIDRSTLPIASATKSTERQYRASIQMLFNPTDRLHVLTGGMFEKGDLHDQAVVGSGGTIDDSYSEFLGRFSTVYDLIKGRGIFSALNIYGSFSQGFNPNLGVKDPDGNFVDAPQKMKQTEIGFKAEMLDGALGGSLVFYKSNITNLPVTSAFLGNVTVGTVLAGERNVKGVEFELIGSVVRGWNVALNYTYTDTEVTDPNYPGIDVQTKMVPHNQGGLFTSYEWLDGPLTGLQLGGGVFVKGKYRLTDNPRLVALWGNLENPGYTRVDLSASYRRKSIEFFANIENVFDKDYFMTWEAHPGFSIVHGEPRTYKGGVRYNFR